MARILILGYGNPLRSDDGLGWRAAEKLAEKFSSSDVEIRTCHQLLPELVDLVSQSGTTFFIDATPEGEPGEVRCQWVVPQPASLRFSHQLSPAAMLAWSRELYGRCPKAFAVSVCGRCFEFGETLSPVVAASLSCVTALVAQLAGQISR
jgi:hydrogenase maturation protease